MPRSAWSLTRRTALLGATAVVASGCASAPDAPPQQPGAASSSARPPKPSSAASTPEQTPERGPVETPVTEISTEHGLTSMWPNEPFDINVTHGTIAEVKVTDTATGEVFPGKVDGSRWFADRGALYVRSHYKIDVTVHDGNGDPHHASATATTVNPGMVVEVDFRFAGEDIGNGMPIWVRFDLPIAAEQRAAIERYATVTTSPPQEGSWGWNDENTLWWRPKEYWIPGSTAHVEVNAAGQAGHDTWVLNNASADYAFGDLRILQTHIDSHTTTCLRNGEVVKVLPVSMGKPGYETMTGTKMIMSKEFKTRMDSASYGVEDGPEAYNLEVYYAQRITWSGEYYHAAPWADYAHGADNVSHGCTGLSNADAEWLFEFTRVGDPAEFTGSTFAVQPHQTWGCWLYSWEDWRKQSAIPRA